MRPICMHVPTLPKSATYRLTQRRVYKPKNTTLYSTTVYIYSSTNFSSARYVNITLAREDVNIVYICIIHLMDVKP